jgi:hypothetical protein
MSHSGHPFNHTNPNWLTELKRADPVAYNAYIKARFPPMTNAQKEAHKKAVESYKNRESKIKAQELAIIRKNVNKYIKEQRERIASRKAKRPTSTRNRSGSRSGSNTNGGARKRTRRTKRS